jgi:hypothetical protein
MGTFIFILIGVVLIIILGVPLLKGIGRFTDDLFSNSDLIFKGLGAVFVIIIIAGFIYFIYKFF